VPERTEPSAEDTATPEVQRELKPPFVETFKSAAEKIKSLLEKKAAGKRANEQLMAISPETSARAFSGEISAASVLQAMDEFDASGFSEADLKRIRREGLQAQANYDKDVADGKVVSEKAAKVHQEWEHTEALVSVDQKRLKDELETYLPGFLDSSVSLSQRLQGLGELTQLVKMVGKGQEQSIRLLVSLRHQAEGVLGGDGKALDQEIADYATAEAKKRQGKDIVTKPEAEILTSEALKARFDTLLAATKLKEHNRDQYTQQLMEKLGLSKETNPNTNEEVWKTSPDSVLRAQMLLEDTVRATREAFKVDLEDSDLDTAEAAFYKAEAMLQGQAMESMAQTTIKNLTTDIFAQQQIDIKRAIDKVAEAERIDQVRQARVQKVRNVGAWLIKNARNAINTTSKFLAGDTPREGRDDRLKANTDRIAELSAMLENK